MTEQEMENSMSIASSIIVEMNNNQAKKLKDKYLSEMKEILEECSVEWQDEYLNPKDFSPPFDYGMEESLIWFNILLGKYLGICDIEPMFKLNKIFNENKKD